MDYDNWTDDQDEWVEDDEDEEGDADLMVCPSCNASVHEDTQQCPVCGDWIIPAWPRKPWKRTVWIATVALLLIAFIMWAIR